MAATTYEKIKLNGNKVQVDSAIRDGNGKVINETYATKTELGEAIQLGEVDVQLNGTATATKQALTNIIVDGTTYTVSETYATITELNKKLDATTAANTYATKTAISDMATKTWANGQFQAKGNYALKSELPTALAELADDETHRLVTDTEKATWNAKAEVSAIPTQLAQLAGDTTHRVVTDAQITNWNAGGTGSAEALERVAAAEGRIKAIEDAPYATEGFVNSSIATNTANFIGTFNSLAELQAYTGTKTNNDYAFVIDTDTLGRTSYKRYKYVASTTSWTYEYTLNNSSFTDQQWKAINSGIDTNYVEDIEANTTARHTHTNKTVLDGITAANLVTTAEKNTWNGKANVSDIPTQLSQLTADATHRLVTDTQVSTWNAKANVSDIPALTSTQVTLDE